MAAKKKSSWFSKIESREDAIKVAKECAAGFFVVAVIQVVLSFIVGASVLVDAALFIVCGFFIRQFFSRVAAVIALILSSVALVVTFLNMTGARLGGGTNIFLALLIMWAAIRAVEATFKLHGQYSEANVPPSLPE